MRIAACLALAVLVLPAGAIAGHQLCGRQVVPDHVRRCPDGSIPMFVADEVKPHAPHPGFTPQPARTLTPGAHPPGLVMPGTQVHPAPAPAAPPAGLDYFFRVWRTRIPGAVWTSPSGYAGYDWLHVSTGVSVGDLIIRPNGTYVWNSYGGKSGRWVRGDAEYPIVLIDTAENRRWKVGIDPRHTGGRDIVLWDGYYWYDGRR